MKLIDQVGKVFGKLTVISYDGNEHWKCQCICGNFVSAYIQRLRQGRYTCCGSIRCKLKIDIVGQRFGRLIVFNDFKYVKKSKYNRSYVKVKCDCGVEKYVMTTGLLGGDITSCGCYKREMQEEKIFKPYRRSLGRDENINLTGVNKLRREWFRRNDIKPKVLKRDNYSCLFCSTNTSKSNPLQIHHIDPVSKNPAAWSEYNNLITVCKNCHYSILHPNHNMHIINEGLTEFLIFVASSRTKTITSTN